MFCFFFKFTMTTYLKKSWSMTLLFAREKNSFKYIGKPHFYYGFPLSSVCVYVHVKFDVKKKFPLLTQWLMHMLWKQLHYLPALLTGFLPLSPFDFTSPSPARWEQTVLPTPTSPCITEWAYPAHILADTRLSQSLFSTTVLLSYSWLKSSAPVCTPEN